MAVTAAVSKLAPMVLGALSSSGGDDGGKGGVFQTLKEFNDRVTVDGKSPVNWAAGRLLTGPTT
jgi:hypothetical protein